LNFEVNENVLIQTRDRRTGGLDYSKYEERSWEYEVESIRYWNGKRLYRYFIVKNMPNAKVYAIDVSEKALATAKKMR
jgi:release factor glutamine methyltransferase